MADRKEMVTWEEVERLVDHLIPQFAAEFDSMVIVTRGGVVPGGMLCEALNIENVMTASVDFPFESQREAAKLLAWPQFIQFPPDVQLTGRKVLVVDDVWGSGRTVTAVKNRVAAAGGFPSTCVLHFNPHRSLFSQSRPDYYAAVTDAYIIFPWEVNRGVDKVLLRPPEQG
jgi:hypoxanthine phosphoribosyltransferase